MGTANFKTMEDFPLIAAEDRYEKICPECHCGIDAAESKCTECGCDLSGVEAVIDDCECEYILGEMENVAKELNEIQPFYTVSVESGYYAGAQFYVEGKYYDLEAMDNEESREEFGVCRSEMLRRFKVAGNTIRRRLRKAKDELGLVELLVTARFSNGETWYSKVDHRKPIPLKVAAKAALCA